MWCHNTWTIPSTVYSDLDELALFFQNGLLQQILPKDFGMQFDLKKVHSYNEFLLKNMSFEPGHTVRYCSLIYRACGSCKGHSIHFGRWHYPLLYKKWNGQQTHLERLKLFLVHTSPWPCTGCSPLTVDAHPRTECSLQSTLPLKVRIIIIIICVLILVLTPWWALHWGPKLFLHGSQCMHLALKKAEVFFLKFDWYGHAINTFNANK